MQTSKFNLLEAFMAMNEETKIEIIKESMNSIAYETHLEEILSGKDSLPRKNKEQNTTKQ